MDDPDSTLAGVDVVLRRSTLVVAQVSAVQLADTFAGAEVVVTVRFCGKPGAEEQLPAELPAD